MSNGGLLKPEKGKSSLDPILNPTIPKSDHIDFESIFEVVKKAAIRFVPEVESNFKRKSTLAVEQVFETAKKSFALDETTEKSLLNFNTLFRETLDIKGLLDVTFEISKLANQYQPAFKADFETIRGLVSSSDNSAAIEHCVKVLEGVTNLDNLQICDINYVLDIQYTLGSLYANRNGAGDDDSALETFLSYMENAKHIAQSNYPSTLIVVQQALHGLSVASKNKRDFHISRIYLEKELQTLNLIQLNIREGKMVLNQNITLIEKYFDCYRAMENIHSVLGNAAESAEFAAKASLAQEGKNFDVDTYKKKAGFVENLLTATEKNFVQTGPLDVSSEDDRRSESSQSDSNEVETDLEDKASRLKEGEIFVPCESLLKWRDELDSLVDLILKDGGAQELAFYFRAEGFDAFCFLEELNADFLSNKDLRSATQRLSMFLLHYIRNGEIDVQ